VWHARAVEGGAGEEERRKDEGTGKGAKEVAQTAGGKAEGSRSLGDEMEEGVLCAMEDGCDGRALRCGAGERHQHIRPTGHTRPGGDAMLYVIIVVLS
jgi:hypothetical protein